MNILIIAICILIISGVKIEKKNDLDVNLDEKCGNNQFRNSSECGYLNFINDKNDSPVKTNLQWSNYEKKQNKFKINNHQLS